jgi:hypothetical protein
MEYLHKEYQTLNVVISTGRSKELLGKPVTVKDLEAMSVEEIEAYYKIYELNYTEKISTSLNHALVSLYSYLVNKVVPIDDVEKLRDDLNNSYILNNEMKNITGGLACVGGKIWSLVELGLTTAKHIKVKTNEECTDNDSTLKELCKEQYKDQCNVLSKEQHKEE